MEVKFELQELRTNRVRINRAQLVSVVGCGEAMTILIY